MPTVFHKLRLASIAFIAIMGALLAADQVSASCTEMPAAGACRAGCGCCKTPESNHPAVKLAGAATVVGRVLSHDTRVSRAARARGCACCSRSPAAPEPKGNRAEESRRDLRRAVAAERFDFETLPRPLVPPSDSTTAPPHQSRLYLHTSRLLI